MSLDLVFGVLTTTITTHGVYTTEAASFTQSASSGFGTGATFNTVLYGVSETSVSAPGTYSALPNNHVVLTGGAGTGASFDAVWSPATFNVTVAGGTHSIAATVNVTTDGAGHISAINSVSAAGSYTVLPALTSNAATGDDGTHHGTGLLLDLVFGVLTTTITTNGTYTTETASLTQSTSSGLGTGATFNTVLYGAAGYSISAPGTYTTVPANHVTLTGGSGTGASFDAVWSDPVGMFSDIDMLGQIVQVTDFLGNGNNSGADYVYMTAGQQLFVRVAFASTFTTYTLRAFVFGFTFT